MPSLMRAGEPLLVSGEALAFSFWPLRRSERRWGRHSMLFAADPWAIIQSAILERCPANDLEAAQSFVRQASKYYSAANAAHSTEAQPLLHYYGFLNLAKALAITRGQANLVGRVSHGLSTDPGSAYTSAEVRAFPTGWGANQIVNAFDEFMTALLGAGLVAPTDYTLGEISAQILFGHRLWVEASRGRERFIGIERIELRQVKSDSWIWVNIVIPERALVWRGRSKQSVLQDGDLAPLFDYVRGSINDAPASALVASHSFQRPSRTSVLGPRPAVNVLGRIQWSRRLSLSQLAPKEPRADLAGEGAVVVRSGNVLSALRRDGTRRQRVDASCRVMIRLLAGGTYGHSRDVALVSQDV